MTLVTIELSRKKIEGFLTYCAVNYHYDHGKRPSVGWACFIVVFLEYVGMPLTAPVSVVVVVVGMGYIGVRFIRFKQVRSQQARNCAIISWEHSV